jgi:hypothetical protein
MDAYLVGPVRDQASLRYNNDGVYGAGGNPRKSKIEANLGLSESLLMEDGSEWKILCGGECIRLVWKAAVFR